MYLDLKKELPSLSHQVEPQHEVLDRHVGWPQKDVEREGVIATNIQCGFIMQMHLDADRDGIPDQYDGRDDRYTNYGSIIRFDRYGHPLTARQVDRDCDGLIDRYDYTDRPYPRDLDCYSNRIGTVTVGAVEPTYVESTTYAEPAGYVRYSVGDSLPVTYMGDGYYIDDYQPYGLAAPPDGYTWNRVGSDVYLAAPDGRIIDVRYDLFH